MKRPSQTFRRLNDFVHDSLRNLLLELLDDNNTPKALVLCLNGWNTPVTGLFGLMLDAL